MAKCMPILELISFPSQILERILARRAVSETPALINHFFTEAILFTHRKEMAINSLYEHKKTKTPLQPKH